MPVDSTSSLPDLGQFAHLLSQQGWNVRLRTRDALMAFGPAYFPMLRIVRMSADGWFFRGDQLFPQRPPIIREYMSMAEILDFLIEFAPGGQGWIEDERPATPSQRGR